MTPVPDRRRLRQEYLRRKRQVVAKKMAYGLLCLAMICLCLCLCLPTLIYVMRANLQFGFGDGLPAVLFTTLIFIFLTVTFAVYFGDQYKEARKAAANVAFVPPVTPDTLPAEEILVRGAEEPLIQQSEILLRAAQAHTTPEDELLRVSQE
jgi:hypothetical protein